MRTFLTLLAVAFLVVPVSAQDWAIEELAASPRHHEWAEVSFDGRTVHSFLTYPEIEGDAPAVIVIHENRGLTDWVRLFADRLAAEGYITIAPTAESMKELGNPYEYEIYDGVGHAFMRQAAAPDADEVARSVREAAFERLLGLLESL